MSAHFPGQKQASFSLSQLPTFTEPLEQSNFSHSCIRMKTAVSVLKPFPPLDTEEERGKEKTERTGTSSELKNGAAILSYQISVLSLLCKWVQLLLP